VTPLTRAPRSPPIPWDAQDRSSGAVVTTDFARARAEHVRARKKIRPAPPRAVALPLVSLACSAALVAGWKVHHGRYWVPDSGLGYAFGVIGLSCMVLLLAYPLRKRLRPLRSWGRLPTWFQVHMLLGVVGPTAILFHSNFELRSLNSGVALASMLLVAGSGFVGRFIHTKIHRELFDHRQVLERLRREAESARGATRAVLSGVPELAARLRSFESFALAAEAGPLRATSLLWQVGRYARTTERACRRLLPRAGRAAAQQRVRAHVRAVRRVAEFRAYARLFSLWHALHVPLCVLLFGAAAFHVVAVHLY